MRRNGALDYDFDGRVALAAAGAATLKARVFSEKDRHEHRSVATRGSVRTSSQRVVAFGGCGGDFAAELPASEAALAALSPGRSGQHAAWQRGAALPPDQPASLPSPSPTLA